jgi:hypothetical protein
MSVAYKRTGKALLFNGLLACFLLCRVAGAVKPIYSTIFVVLW